MKRHAVLAPLLVLALLGCTAADPQTVVPSIASSPDPPPSTAASAEPASQMPSQSASADPTGSAGGLPAGGFAWYQLLVVTADGLAVRRGPTTAAEIAFAAPWDPTTGDWAPTTDEVRLDAGYPIRVSLGPVARDGYLWYEVTNLLEPGQEAETIQWDVDNDGIYSDSGWIAAGDGEETFVEPVPASGDDAPIRPLVFAAGGSGSTLSEPFEAAGDVAGTFVLVTNDLAPCDLTVTVDPSGQTLIATSLIGVFEHGSHGVSIPAGEYRLRIEAGVPGSPNAECGWSIVLFQSVS